MAEDKSTIRSVDRALDILLCFTKKSDWTMTELAEQVGLHKSTVHRMLATLEERGFVEREKSTDRYYLGLKVWELSVHLSRTDDRSAVWLPEMEKLRDQLGETVSVYVRDGMERIRIHAVQSNQPVRRVANVGARLPLYAGASSKVLIAHAPVEVREGLFGDPSWLFFVDLDSYKQQLDGVLARGYATSFEEREPGAAAVAAPIFDRSGQVIAALSLSGPASRLTEERLHQYAPTVIDYAKRIALKTPQ